MRSELSLPILRLCLIFILIKLWIYNYLQLSNSVEGVLFLFGVMYTRRTYLMLDMSLTVRFNASCYCICLVCIMMSEINDDDIDHRDSRDVLIVIIYNYTTIFQPLYVTACVAGTTSWELEDFLEQSFITCMPLLTDASIFGLGRKCLSSPQLCYLPIGTS